MEEKIISVFHENSSLDQAIKMGAYMKNQFGFCGIPKPQRYELQLPFIKEAKALKAIDWTLVFKCWSQPEREFQYFVIDYVTNLKQYLIKDDILNLEKLITIKPWWDTVDLIASNLVGELCKKHPELIDEVILKWSTTKNIWLERTAILFQLKYKENTDTEILEKIIKTHSRSKESFITKAIGWALREYAKTDKKWVVDFIGRVPLEAKSVTEASKYFTKK